MTKIERTIKKEPTYNDKPKYCLLVFGREAKTRIWLVLDGNLLYVDSNSNGDLTDDGKPLQSQWQPGDRKSSYPFSEFSGFDVATEVQDASGIKYTQISVVHSLIKDDFVPATPDDQELRTRAARNPELTRVGTTVYINRKLRQQAVAFFSGVPSEAPIIHFNGPLTMAPLFPRSVLTRGSNAPELQFVVGTPGIGMEGIAILNHDEVPKNVQPTLDVEFPARDPKQPPLKSKTTLKRC